MPYTFVEKALARAAGVEAARAGDVLDVSPDVVLSHDNTAAIRTLFQKIGAGRILRRDRVAITLDHAVPAPTTEHARNHAAIREWVREQGIRHFFEVGRGICHQVLSEEALVLPGETIFGADSHTTHFGWLGAFGMGVGRSEMAALWATGQLWIRVPEALRITLTGGTAPGVTSKDVSLRILGDLGADGGEYRSVEFAGPYLSAIYEATYPERHPLDDSVHFRDMPFDVGFIHYASDTPYTRARTLGSRRLSFEGIDSTYGSTVAIARRILQRESERLV